MSRVSDDGGEERDRLRPDPAGPVEPVGPGPPADFVVPDDASELDLDLLAYRRELAARQRRARVERLFKTRRWQRYGVSGPLTVGVLMVVALFGSMLALLVPTTGATSPPPQTIAGRPAAAPGQVGGLLPDVTLRRAGRPVSGRALRPAVLALLPPGCRCARLLEEIGGQAREFDLPLVLVGAAAPDRGGALRDPAGQLMGTYAARGVTLLLLRDDGVVTAVERDVKAGRRLEPELRLLVTAG